MAVLKNAAHPRTLIRSFDAVRVLVVGETGALLNVDLLSAATLTADMLRTAVCAAGIGKSTLIELLCTGKSPTGIVQHTIGCSCEVVVRYSGRPLPSRRLSLTRLCAAAARL